VVKPNPMELTRLMLLSIKPRHVHNILDGTKSVELRRVRPQIAAGQPVAVYATMPAAAVVATCRVRKVEIGPPSTIKARLLDRAAISADEFDAYFVGANYAVAIHLDEVAVLKSPVTLDEIRSRRSTYNPPQTWHFFDRAQLKDLLGHHGAHHDLSTLLLR
jgi:predicted transcriptional regulator